MVQPAQQKINPAPQAVKSQLRRHTSSSSTIKPRPPIAGMPSRRWRGKGRCGQRNHVRHCRPSFGVST
jgi:hypothetical protein